MVGSPSNLESDDCTEEQGFHVTSLPVGQAQSISTLMPTKQARDEQKTVLRSMPGV
jgi:hypothetical protein